ncbi:hypothetical protein DFH09DRAFT_282526 [Mycena vulgaris]|nr:hypothetical protein DFH09DRAFT_282526 [Mycena vulgaris]
MRMDEEGILTTSAPAIQDSPACCARDPDGGRARHVIARSSIALGRGCRLRAHSRRLRPVRRPRMWRVEMEGRRRRIARCRAASAPPSMSSFATTLVPTVTARRRFAPYTATPSYNTRARARGHERHARRRSRTRYTGDARSRGAGVRSRAGTGERARAGGTSGGERVPRVARRRRRCRGGRSPAARVPWWGGNAPPPSTGSPF